MSYTVCYRDSLIGRLNILDKVPGQLPFNKQILLVALSNDKEDCDSFASTLFFRKTSRICKMDNRFLRLLMTVALHSLIFLQSAREYQRTWICKESPIYNGKTYNEFYF